MYSVGSKVVLPGYSKIPPTASNYYKANNSKSNAVEKKSISTEIPPKDKEELVYEKPTILQIPSAIEMNSMNFSTQDYVDSDED
tara:strand:- start:15502 stop:15753 length:252 start_codon:yes stop_codon:yes gene_type:complete